MKVSVCCMAFNHEKYIRSALEGFVKQKTSFDYEVFVHDDASTDDTAAIIKEYAEKYPKIIKPILQTENQYSQGVDSFEKFIYPRMTGEYFADCEGDDYWIDENKLQIQVDYLDSHPECVACTHNSYKLDMRTNKKTVMYQEYDRELLPTDVLNGGSCCYQTASLVYRRSFASNFPQFYDTANSYGFSDYPFAIYLALNGGIHFIGKVMSVYRVGTESSWTIANTKDMHKNALFHKYVSQMLREVDEYTNHAYAGQIDKLILENDYQELYFDEKYNEMREPRYRELYRNETVSKRIKMRLKHHFSIFYKLYRKLKYGAIQ